MPEANPVANPIPRKTAAAPPERYTGLTTRLRAGQMAVRERERVGRLGEHEVPLAITREGEAIAVHFAKQK